MNIYLDSSAVIRWLLNSQGQYKDFGKWKKAIASEILYVECNRTFFRLRLEKVIDDSTLAQVQKNFNSFVQSIDIIQLDSTILNKASESFPTIISSLDAIHLSTAILYREQNQISNIKILTHDKQLSIAAMSFNFDVVG